MRRKSERTVDVVNSVKREVINYRFEGGALREKILREDFETQSFWEGVIHLLFMYIIVFYVLIKKGLFLLFGKRPRVNFWLFDGLPEKPRLIKKYATSWRALDILYSYEFGKHGFLNDFWLRAKNALAVRNRLKIVRKLIYNKILELSKAGRKVKILSIAAGSAQAVCEAVYASGVEDVEVVLVDLDESALEYCKTMSEMLGIRNKFRFIKTTAGRTPAKMRELGFEPNIIEIVGFLDYVPDKKAVKLLGDCIDILEPGGSLIASNILINPEAPFLRFVVDWRLIYRTVGSFRELFVRAGADEKELETRVELEKMYIIVKYDKLSRKVEEGNQKPISKSDWNFHSKLALLKFILK